ncbi:MAG: thioredoxin domain-containing protein, partial [Flavisolibacter sp.]
YTVFSVYYQWRIAKQWCPLCLAVQALLVLEFITNYFGYWNLAALSMPKGQPFNLSTNQLLSLLTSFLLPVFFWIATKKVYLNAQNGRRYKNELFKLKYNKEIFNALLSRQKQITVLPTGIGITLGNPDATNTIIKVCNPYCGPCAKAHNVIDEILETNEDVKVQIIFTATNDDNDNRAKPVKHLMALHEKSDAALLQKALDDWYGAEQKDYEAFATKYFLNGELQRQGEKLEAMDEWCKATGISFTPTFFVNGYQLPELYKIEDLKHLL